MFFVNLDFVGGIVLNSFYFTSIEYILWVLRNNFVILLILYTWLVKFWNKKKITTSSLLNQFKQFILSMWSIINNYPYDENRTDFQTIISLPRIVLPVLCDSVLVEFNLLREGDLFFFLYLKTSGIDIQCCKYQITKIILFTDYKHTLKSCQ